MNRIRYIVALLALTALPPALRAGQKPAGMHREHTWTCTLSAVNAADRTVTGKHWLASRTFHLGENCVVAGLNGKNAELSDLHSGEKVRIRYQGAEGVWVADRITVKPLRYAGRVRSVDSKAGTVTMEQTPLQQPFEAAKTFRLAENCKVSLADGGHGALADLQPGDHLAIIYELPGGAPVAYQIHDRSSTFTGTLDAIDVSGRSVKAATTLGKQAFNLAARCQIRLPDRPRGSLNDLTVGQRYKFTYQVIDGVNIVDRIAPARETKAAETVSTR